MKDKFVHQSKILSSTIILNLFLIYFLSQIGFLLSFPISAFYVPVATILSVLFLVYVNKKDGKSNFDIIVQLLFYFAFFVVSYFLAVNFWDYSCDGRTYHQLGISLMRNGFNPVYDYNIVSMYINTALMPKMALIDHSLSQPKFIETVAANFYFIFKNIEAGKLLNYLLWFASFLYSYYSLNNFKNIKPSKAILFGVLLNLNPIILSQLQTYYVDGNTYIFFLLIVLTIINIEKREEPDDRFNYAFLFITSAIFASIKMSNLLFIFLIIIFYFAYLICLKNSARLKQMLLLVLSLCVFGIITGVNPYYTNIKQGFDVFYPIHNQFIKNGMKISTPDVIKDKNSFEQFVISIFSPVSNNIQANQNKKIIKLPFTISHEEYISSPDIRLGGFGVFFSGILILSLILLFALRFEDKKEKTLFITLLLILVSSTLLQPLGWWVRFIPQLWLLPLLIMIYSYNEDNVLIKGKFIFRLLVLAILFNSFIFLVLGFKESYKYTTHMKSDFDKIIKSQKTLKLCIPSNDNFFEYSLFTKFYDNNIRFNVINNVQPPKGFELTPECINNGIYWNYDGKH